MDKGDNIKDYYLKALEEEKEKYIQERQALDQKIRLINKMILTRRMQIYTKVSDETVNSKNMDKVFFNSMIVTIVKDGNGISSNEIYTALVTNGYNILYPTLRSYLHRLKKIGKIRQNSNKKWFLTNT